MAKSRSESPLRQAKGKSKDAWPGYEINAKSQAPNLK
jgi:hypothetical protein